MHALAPANASPRLALSVPLIPLALFVVIGVAIPAPAPAAKYKVHDTSGQYLGYAESTGSSARWNIVDDSRSEFDVPNRVGSLRRKPSSPRPWQYFETVNAFGGPESRTPYWAKRHESKPNRWNIYYGNIELPQYFLSRRSKTARWRFYGKPPRTRRGWAVHGYVEAGTPGRAAAAGAFLFFDD